MADLITYQWDGEHMVPLRRFHRRVNAEFVVGEFYELEVIERRSLKSHAQFFAWLHDRHQSLPDHLAIQFPTEDSLRKHAMIMTGFRRERKFATESREAARKLAGWLKLGGYDDYTLISLHDNVVVEWKPASMKMRGPGSMNAATWKDCKTKVMAWIDELIGVTPTSLPEHEAA